MKGDYAPPKSQDKKPIAGLGLKKLTGLELFLAYKARTKLKSIVLELNELLDQSGIVFEQ